MIGKRIQKVRTEKGMTLSELAQKAGVAKSYLSTIERDIQSNPSVQFLEKIASVLGVPVDTFLYELHGDSDEGSPMDPEWIGLFREAMSSGISKEQFKEFVEFNRWRLERNSD